MPVQQRLIIYRRRNLEYNIVLQISSSVDVQSLLYRQFTDLSDFQKVWSSCGPGGMTIHSTLFLPGIWDHLTSYNLACTDFAKCTKLYSMMREAVHWVNIQLCHYNRS